MTSENISLLFSVQGLLLLGTFLAGFNNNEIWLNSSFYILLPLFCLVLIASFFSLFSKKHYHIRRKVIVYFLFNLVSVMLLLGFVSWATSGTFI